MNPAWLEKARPDKGADRPFLIIAHRGDRFRCPENTLPAFLAAADQDVDAVELDVAQTADGHLVVLHDDTVNRTTNGKGMIWSMKWDQARRLDAGAWFSPRFAGTPLPELSEVLEALAGRAGVNVEIKKHPANREKQAFARDVVRCVMEHGMENQVVFSSFDPPTLAAVRQADQDAAIGVLSNRKQYSATALNDLAVVSGVSFHPNEKHLTRELVQGLHQNNIPVVAWAANGKNTAHTMKKVLDAGCDGFFADDPRLMRKVMKTS